MEHQEWGVIVTKRKQFQEGRCYQYRMMNTGWGEWELSKGSVPASMSTLRRCFRTSSWDQKLWKGREGSRTVWTEKLLQLWYSLKGSLSWPCKEFWWWNWGGRDGPLCSGADQSQTVGTPGREQWSDYPQFSTNFSSCCYSTKASILTTQTDWFQHLSDVIPPPTLLLICSALAFRLL